MNDRLIKSSPEITNAKSEKSPATVMVAGWLRNDGEGRESPIQRTD